MNTLELIKNGDIVETIQLTDAQWQSIGYMDYVEINDERWPLFPADFSVFDNHKLVMNLIVLIG